MTLSGQHKQLPDSVVADLRARFESKLLLPWDEEYEQTRRVWNGMIDKKPALIVRCTGVADVIDSVKVARTHQLLVAVRGSGHNVAGSASCDGGMMIDLSLMKGIRVDPQHRTVRAQPGVQLGELDREAQAFGLAVPGGLVSDTGIAGLTLGGGIGWLRRKYGLTCDNLLSVDLVTADGQFLTASTTEHPELLWGIRGGGGNFGIVTSFLYQAHPVGPDVMFAFILYPADEAATILHQYRAYTREVPDEVSSMALYATVPSDDRFLTSIQGTPCLILAACYTGPVAIGQSLLQPLRTFGSVIGDLSGPQRYIEVQRMFDAEYPHGRQYYWKSLYLHTLSDSVIDTIGTYAQDCPSPLSTIDLWHLGGAISRVPSDATAISVRHPPFLLAIESNWEDPEASDTNIEWTRDFWRAMHQFSDGEVFFNFPGFLEEGPTLLQTSFGRNYTRLLALKQQYDPHNLFRLNHNIQPLK